jgi:phage baseplate assembly protein W
MIPNIKVLTEEITKPVYPNRTYKINFNIVKPSTGDTHALLGVAILGKMLLGVVQKSDTTTVNRISGYVNDLEAVQQAIYLILSTERYKHIIYSWDYGVELLDLIGKPMPYVMAELPRRITEALTQDNRIEDVVDFEFETKGKRLHVKFTVVSSIGNIPTELEVEV